MASKIVIFASGSGSNTENIIRYFSGNKQIIISLVVSNNHKAKVLDRANKLGIPTLSFNRLFLDETEGLKQLLIQLNPRLIVLAGFLKKIPETIVSHFNHKIINIHPSLLPKYGGKGMYGIHVHRAVLAANEKTTGITIHYVTEEYDKGAIIFQKRIPINSQFTAEQLADSVRVMEHEYFPKTIEKLLNA